MDTRQITTMNRQIVRQTLIIAVGIAAMVAPPVTAEVPAGATEVWPTDTLAAIQAAVDAGGVVYFHPGTYNWTGILSIGNSVEIAGPEPTGDFDTKTGTDNRTWKTKLTKTPTGIWDTMDCIIRIDCPGETERVTIRNLDTECLSLGMCMLLQGRGHSVTIASCRIKTIDDGYGFVTWQASTRSVVVEDCYLEAGTTGFLYPDDTVPNTDCIVFGMSNHATMEVRNSIAVNHCDTTDTSTAVEVVWNHNPNTEVIIRNNWLQSSGIGFAIFHGEGVCPVGTVSHNTVVGGRHFLHYKNSTGGGTIEHNRFDCSGGDVSLYFMDSEGVTVQRNTFVGNVLTGAITLTGNSSRNVFVANDLSGLKADTAQILVAEECQNNLFARNFIGSLGPDALAAIQCSGDNNDIIRNDYTRSGIPGPVAEGTPCVWLANTCDPDTGALVAEPENNLVFEADGLPPGTATTNEVLDDPRQLTGNTTNIVIGH